MQPKIVEATKLQPRPPGIRPGIPGNRGPPKFPAGIPGNFWNSGGNYGEFRSFVFFSIFIVGDILVFNLTHCIMCTTHDRLTAFWAKPWMTSLTQLFVYRVPVYFKYWYRKITEQRQIFANSDRYTNEDAEIRSDIGYRPRFCIHQPGVYGRCSKGRQCPGDVCPDRGGVCWYNGDRSLPVSLDMWDGWKAVHGDIWVDFKT